jgi:hypothetical protein
MADLLLNLVEPVCDMLCCNPPIKHTYDESKTALDKTFTFGAPTTEDFNNKSGEVGSASADFTVKNISMSEKLTITGANVYITGDIKLNTTLTIKATGTVVIQGVVQNKCHLVVHAKELYINGGLMNECSVTALVTETIVIRGSEYGSMINNSELLVGFTKSGAEEFKNGVPCKLVLLEDKVVNECTVRAYCDTLIFKKELINSVVVNAYVKEYMCIGKSETSSLINKCIINVFAFKVGDKSEQSKLVEIQGQIINECSIVANTSLLWINDRVINKVNIKHVAKCQKKCGLYLPWRLAGSTIVQDPNMTGATLDAETGNPLQA